MRYLKALSAPPSDGGSAAARAAARIADDSHRRHDEEGDGDEVAAQRLLLGEGGGSAIGLEEAEQKFEQLNARSQRLRSSRLQVIALAFASGGLTLSAILGLAAARGGAC